MCSLELLISCIEQQAKQAEFLSLLDGGNERWLQGQILLCLSEKLDLQQNVTVFQEHSFYPDTALSVDIVFCSNPKQKRAPKKWNLVELKFPGKHTKQGDVIADITRLWPNPLPVLKGFPDKALGGGKGFVAILVDKRRYDPGDVLKNILNGFGDKTGITKTDVEQKFKGIQRVSENLFLLIFEFSYL